MTVKLLSLDVWDTLLRRKTAPGAIKFFSAQHIFYHLRQDLPKNYADAKAIYELRLATERKLGNLSKKRGLDDEYELSAVLTAMLDHALGEGVISPTERASWVAKFYQYEIECEINHSFPDPAIADFIADYAAEQTIFLSDFYLTTPAMQQILAAHGWEKFSLTGFTSASVGFNKRSGNLFRHVHKELNIKPSAHIHIGDHPWSDVRIPRKLGITSILYQPDKLHQDRSQREMIFTDQNRFLSHWRHVTETHSYSTSSNEPDRQAWSLGVATAPLWVGFVQWVAEQALSHKIDKLFFLTREGEFFAQIYQTLYPNQKLHDHQLPPTAIFASSRQASFAAALNGLSPAEMGRSWDLHKVQNLRGFFALFNLDPADFSDILAEFNLNIDQVIHDPQHDQNFAAFINHPKMQQAANAAIARQKSMLVDYARQSGIQDSGQDGGKIGLVDIGWRGSIMDNISRILPNHQFYGYFLGLRRFINPQPANGQKFAYGPDETIKPGNEIKLFESFAAMEALCQSRAGAVVGYERVGDHIAPMRPVSAAEKIAHDRFTAPYQAGVIEAARQAARLLPLYGQSGDKLRPAALAIWKKIQTAPPEQLAQEILSLPQQDIFGLGDQFVMRDVPPVKQILKSIIFPSERRNVLHYLRRAQWGAAMAANKDLGFLHRLLLVVMFRAANGIKILLMWYRSW
ncbi:MAG: hypothetical protein QM537_02900 [Candidatus Symbiobacter sp.]|nr:hypothetical protein [Candidatus Symbiobacter sp.]